MTGVAAGTTNITAMSGGATGSLTLSVGAAGITKITISPASPQLYTGGQQQFAAAATYTNGSAGDITSQITWSVSPTSVATISAGGLLQTVAAGSFTVTAIKGAVTATDNGTVTDPTLTAIAITPTPVSVSSGLSQQFTATGTYNNQAKKHVTNTVTWASSNAAVLTINATGLATAGAVSTATPVSVTATTASLSASAAVTGTGLQPVRSSTTKMRLQPPGPHEHWLKQPSAAKASLLAEGDRTA